MIISPRKTLRPHDTLPVSSHRLNGSLDSLSVAKLVQLFFCHETKSSAQQLARRLARTKVGGWSVQVAAMMVADYDGGRRRDHRHLRLLVVSVLVDFGQRFAHQSADPHAHVGRQTVHQTETGDHFEFVNIQLSNHKNNNNNNRQQ